MADLRVSETDINTKSGDNSSTKLFNVKLSLDERKKFTLVENVKGMTFDTKLSEHSDENKDQYSSIHTSKWDVLPVGKSDDAPPVVPPVGQVAQIPVPHQLRGVATGIDECYL